MGLGKYAAIALVMAGAVSPLAADTPGPNTCTALARLILFTGLEDAQAIEAQRAGVEEGCHAALVHLNLAAGLSEPNCAALLYDLEVNGVPTQVMGEAGQIYERSLAADDPEECAEALGELSKLR